MPLKAEKKELRVTIYTERHKITGSYFVVPDARFSDDLNARQKDFIPITRATIHDLDGSGDSSMSSEFMMINKHHIVLLFAQTPSDL
jgi:hypothetical protein